MSEYLPFSKPTITQEAIDEVVACLKSGWLTTGPRVQQFETLLQTYLQAPQVLALASATAGLHLALLALKLQPGDEVITTPLTFIASLNTIVLAGGKPVLVDVIPNTYNINPMLIKEAITPKTKAIMPVHFAGLPVDLDPVYDLAKQHGLRVIEDAAHAIGTQYKGKLLGSFGDTQIFSFHPNKNMTTGEGGCITTADPLLAKKISVLRFHGIDRETWNRFSKAGSQDYEVIAPGYKYNMMDIQAALGIHQLPLLESFITKRTQLAERYTILLKDNPEWILPGKPDYSHRHAWHLYAPVINPSAAGMNRDEFMQRMKEANIGIGLHYHAAHLYSYYREQFGFKPGAYPHAEMISEGIVSLPLFPTMTFGDQDHVIETMQTIFKHRK